MSYIDTISTTNEELLARWYAWQLRLLLLIGVSVLCLEWAGWGMLPVAIPQGVCVYLALSSCYFALVPRGRLMRVYQKVCTFACFPGAFVTSVLPIYIGLFSWQILSDIDCRCSPMARGGLPPWCPVVFVGSGIRSLGCQVAACANFSIVQII